MTTEPTTTGRPDRKRGLRDADIPAIGDACRAGASVIEIAKRFGVSPNTVYGILAGKIWTHVPGGTAALPYGRRGSPPGEASSGAKLRDADIPLIADAYRAGELMKDIGSRFGVSKSQISNVLCGKTWSHVPGGVVAERRVRVRKPRKPWVKVGRRRGERAPTAKLTDAKVIEARELRRQGAAVDAIAQRFGVTQSTASALLCGKTWSHLPGAVPAPARPRIAGRPPAPHR